MRPGHNLAVLFPRQLPPLLPTAAALPSDQPHHSTMAAPRGQGPRPPSPLWDCSPGRRTACLKEVPLKGHYGLSTEHCLGQQSRSRQWAERIGPHACLLTAVPVGLATRACARTHTHTHSLAWLTPRPPHTAPQTLGHRAVVNLALCPQDVAALQYRAPSLAVDCLTQALPGPPQAALILDVACGTGLVAAEVRSAQIPCPLLSPPLAHMSCHPGPRFIGSQTLGLYPLQAHCSP